MRYVWHEARAFVLSAVAVNQVPFPDTISCRWFYVLHCSLLALRAFGDIRGGTRKGLIEVVPGIKVLHKLSGMKDLAHICLRCVNGDSTLRLKSEKVVEMLADFKAQAEFHWRHGTNIVYHTLEPGDKLKFSKKGAFVGLTRLPRTSGSSPTRSEHIKRGSAFDWRSPYISCSLNFAFCVFYAQKQESMFSNDVFKLAPILEIDLAKLGGNERGDHIFDGTNNGEQTSCEMNMVERFAADADEVILDGIEVPRSAVTAVYNMDYKTRPAGESSKKTTALVGSLQKMGRELSAYASDRSSPFGKWERRFYKHTRPKGGSGSVVELIKKQALVQGDEMERVLRNSYCGRREDTVGARSCDGGGGDESGGRRNGGGGSGSGPPTGGGSTRRRRSSGRNGGNGNSGGLSPATGAAGVGGSNQSGSSGSGGGSTSSCSRGGDGGGGASKSSAKGGKGKKRQCTEGVQSEHKIPKRS